MALNVNIIGRDSEGNLQALKVNSEGNLEISGFSEWGELLQDISDNLDVLVSGTEAVVIKEHVLTNQTSQCFVGQNGPTTYTLIDPLDVRQYTKRYVRVRNLKDVSIDVNLSMGSLLRGSSSSWYRTSEISIPARSDLYMDASLVPQLETIPYNGMFVSVRSYDMPPEGDIIITFVGG